jgi:hypothetical protein
MERTRKIPNEGSGNYIVYISSYIYDMDVEQKQFIQSAAEKRAIVKTIIQTFYLPKYSVLIVFIIASFSAALCINKIINTGESADNIYRK